MPKRKDFLGGMAPPPPKKRSLPHGKKKFKNYSYSFLSDTSDEDDFNASLNASVESEPGLLSQVSIESKPPPRPALIPILQSEKRWKEVEQMIKIRNAEIITIKRLENHPHENFFKLSRKQMMARGLKQRILGWHGTRKMDPEKMLLEGNTLDLRYSQAGCLFGQGIYVASNLAYTDNGYVHRCPGGTKKVILCECLVGKSMDYKSHTPETAKLRTEPKGYDSVRGYPDTDKEMYILYQNHQVYPKYLVEYFIRSPNQRHQPYVVQPPRVSKPSTGVSGWLRGSANPKKASKSRANHASLSASKKTNSYRRRFPDQRYYQPASIRCKVGHHQANFKFRWKNSGHHPYYFCTKCKDFGSSASVKRNGNEEWVPEKVRCTKGHIDGINERFKLMFTKNGFWFACGLCDNDWASKAISKNSKSKLKKTRHSSKSKQNPHLKLKPNNSSFQSRLEAKRKSNPPKKIVFTAPPKKTFAFGASKKKKFGSRKL